MAAGGGIDGGQVRGVQAQQGRAGVLGGLARVAGAAQRHADAAGPGGPGDHQLRERAVQLLSQRLQFLEEGLQEVFQDVAAITDYTGNLELSFLDYTMEDKAKYTVEECKERDATYAKPIKVRVRLLNKETGEIKEQEIFMGDFPLMTQGGTFVINGAERVIVSQIVRSPGM